MSNSIALLAGEASGDVFGAALADELRRRAPYVDLFGLGAGRMVSAGVDVLCHASHWAAIGVLQSIRVVPELRFRVLPRLLSELRRRRPEVVVPIDFGAFNMPVARWCKRQGLRVLYYVPPGSWRRRGALPVSIAQATDVVAAQFPWAAERLLAAGANAHFVGHPLLDVVRPTRDREALGALTGLRPDGRLVALLPGSRPAEIAAHVALLTDAAVRIARSEPDTVFAMAIGSGTDAAAVTARCAKATAQLGAGRWAIVQGATHDVMACSAVGLVCSGTATLEAALLRLPMAIFYAGSPAMFVEYMLRRVYRVEHIGLPNIIADARVVPEYVARAATPPALADAALKLLTDVDARASMLDALVGVRSALGEPGATSRTAELTLSLAGISTTEGGTQLR